MHLVLFFDGGRVLITIRGVPLIYFRKLESENRARKRKLNISKKGAGVDMIFAFSLAEKIARSRERITVDVEPNRNVFHSALTDVSNAFEFLRTTYKRESAKASQPNTVTMREPIRRSPCRATRTRRASKAAIKAASGDTGDPDPEPRRRLPKSRLARLSIAAVWRFLRPDNPSIQQTVNCIPDHADACASESLIAVCLEHAA
ncbi:hypothetical protein LH424_10785 [Laribacter hongkongensis]|uniref:hypothetical protein n=1 Tax=Laribacter hongkongensis TaxID=168471 RepID=UPI001EFCB316|nr:hypothetical protein [Laribacter hongkongensis]MCG8996431.1 hypothetical protein [Laribacter hongkongensis]MCG9047576.1 hypothetical protein [Laribacter hongkongensis]